MSPIPKNQSPAESHRQPTPKTNPTDLAHNLISASINTPSPYFYPFIIFFLCHLLFLSHFLFFHHLFCFSCLLHEDFFIDTPNLWASSRR
ncbi:hypothetical protein EUGRSUZ_J02580 [Eucalyptus grandis]|uniref:Uncharacterized protein n=2 Tax=Eucalyptus grandis TaxID=71139 RepID=A0ACC3J969_EUCGR|nr:hypothetical protein EUGRSUZ_J02580 [Eucalyptus grandis]